MIALLLSLSLAHAEDLPDARVVMPWTDFEDLYRKGMAPEDEPEPAPKTTGFGRMITSFGRIVTCLGA